jgi:WD40 repeat protein/energy-coupling factor transporter ATP-binding protein EcfA2
MGRMPQLENPFVGLRPYEADDSLYYFGRGEQIKTLMRQLHLHRFVAVVGSSGSGKSSLVRAGLIPQLEAGFLVQDRDQWHVGRMKPGEDPIGYLAHSIREAFWEDGDEEENKAFAARLRDEGVSGLLDYLHEKLDDGDGNLLLLVDQFEELFRFRDRKRLKEQKEESEEFVAMLLRLVEQRKLPIFVVLTMRSDFLGDCDAFYRLPEAINDSQFLVPRLTRAQRREVITSPILLSGMQIAPRLVDRLLNENMDTRDDLPVLQHVMLRAWDVWTRDPEAPGCPIEIRHYEAAHTIHGSLNHHAEEALDELNERQRFIAKRMFQSMTEMDMGNRRIRRPCRLQDICALTEADHDEVLEVIHRFVVDGRSFVVLSGGDLNANPLVDISHESLIRQWTTLKAWVEEEADASKIYVRLAETAILHSEGKADLYRGPELENALLWKERVRPNALWAERYLGGFELAMKFLESSRQARTQRREAAEKARREKEQLLQHTAELAEQKLEQEARARRLTHRALRITQLIGVAMVVLAGFSFVQWNEADKQKEEAQRQEQSAKLATFKAQAQTLKANFNLAKAFEEKSLSAIKRSRERKSVTSYQQVWMYALEAASQELTSQRDPLKTSTLGTFASTDIKQAFSEHWVSAGMDLGASVLSIAYSDDGKWMASGMDDNRILLWDSQSGKLIRSLAKHTDGVTSLEFGPDSTSLVSGSKDGTVMVWNAANGKIKNRFEGHSGAVLSVAFSPDGKLVASGSEDASALVWDLERSELLHVFEENEGYVSSVDFSRDSKLLAAGSWDMTIAVWQLEDGHLLQRLEGHEGYISGISFGPDGLLASAAWDQSIRLWDAVKGQLLGVLEGHEDYVSSLAFNHAGDRLVSSSGDSTLRVWDPDSEMLLQTLKVHGSIVNMVRFSADDQALAAAFSDHTIRFWSVKDGTPLRDKLGHDGAIGALAFSPKGDILVSGAGDNTILFWDIATGKMIRSIDRHGSYISGLLFTPDGNTLISASGDNTIRWWDVKTGKEIRVTQAHLGDVSSIALSPDGKLLVSGGSDALVKFWNADDGTLIHEDDLHGARINSLDFSPDGKLLATGSADRSAVIWNLDKREPIYSLADHQGEVTVVRFSADGLTLATGSWDNAIRMWDVTNGTLLNTMRDHHAPIASLAFSADGRFLASGSNDYVVRLWHADSGVLQFVYDNQDASTQVLSFSADGAWLAGGFDDHSVRIWSTENSILAHTLNSEAPGDVFIGTGGDRNRLFIGEQQGRVQLRRGQDMRPISEFALTDGKMTAMAVYEPRDLVIGGLEDGSIHVWKASTGEEVMTLGRHQGAIKGLDVSPDGRYIASSASDGGIRLWNLQKGGEVQTLTAPELGPVSALDFSPDGQLLVSGGRHVKEGGIGQVMLWDVEWAKELGRFEGHEGDVQAVRFNAKGDRLVSGAWDGTLRLWDVSSRKPIHVFEVPGARTTSLAFSNDGRLLASGGTQTLLWSLDSYELLRSFPSPEAKVSSLAFQPEGLGLVIGDQSGQVKAWDLRFLSVFHAIQKNRKLAKKVSEALSFLWEVRLDGLELLNNDHKPALFPQDGYYFTYDPAYRPLLDPPVAGSSKMEQVFEWAMEQSLAQRGSARRSAVR